MDPEVVAALFTPAEECALLARLTPREREAMAHMAEGRSNAAIADRPFIARRASTHINHIFDKLGLPPSSDDHRRVPAVLAFLDAEGTPRRG